MKYVDLHIHSTFSDGKVTPKNLVSEILDYLDRKEEELGEKCQAMVALTDHDTVGGVAEFLEEASKYPDRIEAIGGVEISSDYHGVEIHMLGYGVDYQNPEFLAALDGYRAVRNERNVKMMEKFREAGFDVSLDELVEMYHPDIIGRALIAYYLMEKGYVSTVSEAFDKYIGNNGPFYIPRILPSAEESIALITKFGGTPVLAHPMLYRKFDENAKLKMFQDMACDYPANIKGVETYYVENSVADQKFTAKMADKFGLFRSIGSDYHGVVKPTVRLFDGHGGLQETLLEGPGELKKQLFGGE